MNWGPGPVGGTPGAANATIVTVSINNTTVTEQNGDVTATLTVSLSSAATEVVTVDYATADGTALAGTDYVAKSGQVTFQPGQTQQTIEVTVRGDQAREDDEEFDVLLSNATNAGPGDVTGRVTIENDDTSPSISVGDVSVTEGAAGTSALTFVLQLSAASVESITVDVQTADASALAGEDYVSLTQTVTFEPGMTTVNAVVTINGDATVEPTEKFFLNLSNPTLATIADDQAAGRIFSDDPVAAPWQNAALPRDVNDDGVIDADDANAIFADLSANQPRFLTAPTIDSLPPYLDVNGNNRVTALDALLIIDWLNRDLTAQAALQAASEDPGLAIDAVSAAQPIQQGTTARDFVLAADLWRGKNASAPHSAVPPPGAGSASSDYPASWSNSSPARKVPVALLAAAETVRGDMHVRDRSHYALCMDLDDALDDSLGERTADRQRRRNSKAELR